MENVTREMIAELKEVFVTKDECNKLMDAESEKIAEIKIDMAKICGKLNIMIGILSAIGCSILGVCVKVLFGG